MFDHQDKLVVFYDRSLRLWTAFYQDAEGNQTSSTGYGSSSKLAVQDIEVRYATVR